MWNHLIRRVFATFHAGTRAPPLLLLSLPQPSVPYKHTKLSVSGCSSQQHGFCDISPWTPAPYDNQGPRISDISKPQAEGAKQLARTEEELSQMSRDLDHSGLMVIVETGGTGGNSKERK